MFFPRTLILFLILLPMSLSALPGIKDIRKNKQSLHQNDTKERMITYPPKDSLSNPEPRRTSLGAGGPRESSEKAGVSSDNSHAGGLKSSSSIGSFVGVSVEQLKNVPMESAADRLEKTLERLRRNHPGLATEIEYQQAASLSVDQRTSFKERLIASLPAEIHELFECARQKSYELETQAKNVLFSTEDAKKLIAQARSIRAKAYKERDDYVAEQLQNIKDVHRINYVLQKAKLLWKATKAAAEIKPISSPIFGSLLSSCFSSLEPDPTELLEKFKNATSGEERSAALDAIRKIKWNINFSEIDQLIKNTENRKDLHHSLTTIAENFPLPITQQTELGKLADGAFQLDCMAEKILEFDRSDRFGIEDLTISLEQKRKDILDHIERLAPGGYLVASLQSGEMAINSRAVKESIDATIFDIPEGSSMEESKKDLEREIFRFFCSDIALKFQKDSSKFQNIAPKIKSWQNAGKKIEDLFGLANKINEYRTRLLCTALFLDVLSSDAIDTRGFFNWVRPSRYPYVEESAYGFLERANRFIFNDQDDMDLALSNIRSLLAPKDNDENQCYFEYLEYLNLKGAHFKVHASIMELTRATRDESYEEVAQYHLQAALLFMKAASEVTNNRRKEQLLEKSQYTEIENKLSLKLRIAGERLAMAAYLERKKDFKKNFNVNIKNVERSNWEEWWEASKKQEEYKMYANSVALDDMTPKDYAKDAQQILLRSGPPDDYNLQSISSLVFGEPQFYEARLKERWGKQIEVAKAEGNTALEESLKLRIEQSNSPNTFLSQEDEWFSLRSTFWDRRR